MKSYRLGWLMILLLSISLSGCGNSDTPETSEGTVTDSTVEIPQLYKQKCISCHGDQLQGTAGPNLQKVGDRLSEQEITLLIEQGKGGMPAFGNQLDQDEIKTLVTWLSEQK